MHSPKRVLLLLPLCAVAACADAPVIGPADEIAAPAFALADIVSLGDTVFSDKNLSLNRNQSCQTCHEPSEGFAGAVVGVTQQGSAIQGSVAGKFGDRKPPTAAYATPTPRFTLGGGVSGGLFWDGRATGGELGSPAADQAMGPFLNPVEQALPDAACVVWKVRQSGYAGRYRAAYGTDIDAITFPSNVETVCGTAVAVPGEYVVFVSPLDRPRVTTAYQNIARAVAAYEATFNKFTAKVDKGGMTALEQEGLKLFGGKGKCQQCHSNKGAGALFTDFRFHNLGVPKNPANVKFNYTTTDFDPGLGGFTGNSAHLGRFRTPTTRNVAMGVNRTYMHNGVLKSLKQVVDFYNTRDVLRRCTEAEIAALNPADYGTYDQYGNTKPAAQRCWPAPEFAGNMDTKQMGNLGLSEAQVNAIVAYLGAMSDL